jgi:hypothetical protein
VFLSRFDPEKYVELIKLGNRRADAVFASLTSGCATGRRRLGRLHASFAGREDALKRVERGCHEAAMNVIGYYMPDLQQLGP